MIGVGLGFLLWFTGFTVIGGEWFVSGGSRRSGTAFPPPSGFTVTLLLVLIFVMQPDGEG